MSAVTEKRRVCIVEDDPFLSNAYRIRFDQESIETILTANANEAIELFVEEPPHALVLDIRLPGMNGFEFLEMMRDDERWGKVPVLIVSNLSQDKDIRRGLELGAVEYIVKANTKIGDVVNAVIRYLS